MWMRMPSGRWMSRRADEYIGWTSFEVFLEKGLE